jgi:two-component system, OmpR family, response regulator
VARVGHPRVLVVDDQAVVRSALAGALRSAGFATQEAGTGRSAQLAIEKFRPDLVVLDVRLPDLDSFEIARRLRVRRPFTSVIFTSERGATEDKVAGLALGDDYVTKPFSVAEIVARVRAVLRRTREEEPSVLRFADVVLDERTHEVWCAGDPVALTPREFDLLRFFMANPRRVQTKRQILDNVWDHDSRGDASVVETYVSYLRRKLAGSGRPLIQTVRLVGYALREPGSSSTD